MRACTTRWATPLVPPLCHSAWRLRLPQWSPRDASVRRSASAFIHPSISTAPLPGSVVTQGSRRFSG